MNERIEMLKEMVEKTNKPVGWIGYHEGHLVSFLQTQKQVDLFLKNTDTAGAVKPVYTHPAELTDEEIYDILWNHFPISDKEKNATMIAVMTHCIRVALRKAQERQGNK